jgi:hypothetical protein
MSTFNTIAVLEIPVQPGKLWNEEGNSLADRDPNLATKMVEQWQRRLSQDCELSPTTQTSVIHWLLGEDLDRFDLFTPIQLEIVTQGIDYRYRILSQRYLGVSPTRAYKNLMQRLGGLVVLRQQIQAWVAGSRDRKRTVGDVLQEVVQEITHRDKYIQQQIVWIAQCTRNPNLRNTLLLATIEEYCLRPIRQQPLIAHRFVNYLRKIQNGGVTYLPPDNFVKMVSAVAIDEDESGLTVNLIDQMLWEDNLAQHEWEETQILRNRIQELLSSHLAAKLGTDASEWMNLYLQGKDPEEIGKYLQLDLQQVYRLREKVVYHAKVFAIKHQTEIVDQWLKISLDEHNLGLTKSQWTSFLQSLTPKQLHILTQLKAGASIGTIAKTLNLKTNQVEGEWKQVYLAAQNLRTTGIRGEEKSSI